ncbi:MULTISPECIES: hypothetical protein [unclassified Streptomyces]|uniref:hypothetical protein n=1 Tax=unclassified Streptomyces TaxID=2593676 RepID=UPI000CD53B21|nr:MULTISPECIES: hypothetical protein [unclassified Streptomyces]
MSDEDELVVDYELLDSSASELGTLRDEFNGLGDWQNDLAATLGHRGVHSAVEEFVDNWKYGRRKLVSQLEDLGAAVEGARDAFGETDGGLEKHLVQGE